MKRHYQEIVGLLSLSAFSLTSRASTHRGAGLTTTTPTAT